MHAYVSTVDLNYQLSTRIYPLMVDKKLFIISYATQTAKIYINNYAWWE